MLLLLERHELTVSEICQVLQVPQSTASRHLRVLADEGWVVSRAEGTSRLYTMAASRLQAPARRLWSLVKEEVTDETAAAHDAGRLRSVLAARRARSQEFFSTAAGQWDRVRMEMFGARADLVALLALVDDDWTVGDLGCGTGRLAETMAPFVRQVVAVDASPAMLGAARRRLGSLPNVEVRAGELEALPLDDDELDAALLVLVLHYVVEPAVALGEAARTLRPGGRLLVVDMVPHGRDEYRQAMGHVWTGFSAAQMTEWAEGAGFDGVRYLQLRPDPEALGPSLFALSARRGK